MPKVDGGITIHRPAPEVFSYATSAESHLRWVPGIRSAEYIDDGPITVGSRWRAIVAFGGIQLETLNEVTDMVPARRFAWRSIEGPVRSTGEYAFTPLGDSTTRFDYLFLSDDRLAALVGGFALPVALRLVRREVRSRLERVKLTLEAGEVSVA